MAQRTLTIRRRTRNLVEFDVEQRVDDSTEIETGSYGATLDARTFAVLATMLADDVTTVDITGRSVKHETIARRVEHPEPPPSTDAD